MMLGIALAAAIGTAAPAADHAAANPVFRGTTETGVSLTPGFSHRFPPPSMADGLDTQKQQAVIAAVLSRAYPEKQFVRRSVVAPHVLRMSDIDTGDSKQPGRRVEAWFVAFGDFDRLADKEFLDRLLKPADRDLEGEAEGRDWSKEELARRGITIEPGREKHEGYGRAAYSLLKRVRLCVTGHAFWSRTDDSILAAAVVDPRFHNDPEFPNRWFSITKASSGKDALGPPQPYHGAGFYAKLTRLAEPPGAIFVECHLVFAEPREWFGGTNLLGSKLPAVVQSQVRAMRRELLAGPKATSR